MTTKLKPLLRKREPSDAVVRSALLQSDQLDEQLKLVAQSLYSQDVKDKAIHRLQEVEQNRRLMRHKKVLHVQTSTW